MPSGARSPARSSRDSSGVGSRSAPRSCSSSTATSPSAITPSTSTSRSSVSSSISSRRRRRSRSSSRGSRRSPSSGRRWARRTRRAPPPGRSAATSRWRCRTTSSTAPTRPSRPRARSSCGSTPMTSELSDAERNRGLWTRSNAEYTDRAAPEAWGRDEITWGEFRVPESRLDVLGDVAGQDVVELGCGTAYFSSWLARRGARPVGVDVTPAQLATARAMQRRFGPTFPLVEASAEEVPLAGERFDLALSEYGASIWCDPYRWIPEAARLLREGGRLVFLCNAAIMMLTADELGFVGTELRRDYFGMHRFEWPD